MYLRLKRLSMMAIIRPKDIYPGMAGAFLREPFPPWRELLAVSICDY
jgi:hypothetical protein